MREHYGKVFSSFWQSKLSDDGKLLLLYLMSSPHASMIGAYRLPDGYLIEDMGWTDTTRIKAAFDELGAARLAVRNESSKWVIVLDHLQANAPENPNQATAAIKLFRQVPQESGVKKLLAEAFYNHSERVRELYSEDLKPFLNRCETVDKGLPEIDLTLSKPEAVTVTETETIPQTPKGADGHVVEPEGGRRPFVRPSVIQVADYMAIRGFGDPNGEAQKFVDWYNGSNWRGITDWKARVNSWESKMREEGRWIETKSTEPVKREPQLDVDFWHKRIPGKSSVTKVDREGKPFDEEAWRRGLEEMS